MMTITPFVSPDVFAVRPDFSAVSLYAENVVNAPSNAQSRAWLQRAVDEQDKPEWANAHLNAWREAYRACGLKPKRTPCSAEALRKRAQKDQKLPEVNAVVDLYNALTS